jgi:hypothetical protein
MTVAMMGVLHAIYRSSLAQTPSFARLLAARSPRPQDAIDELIAAADAQALSDLGPAGLPEFELLGLDP